LTFSTPDSAVSGRVAEDGLVADWEFLLPILQPINDTAVTTQRQRTIHFLITIV